MPENPLLPNAKLQQLYAAMLRARHSAGRRSVGREAVFSAVTQLLESGDAAVSSSHGNVLAELLLPSRRSIPSARSLTAARHPLAFSNGVAAGAQVAAKSGLIVVLLDDPQVEPGWAEQLGQAQSERLPLIVVCLATSAADQPSKGSAATGDDMTWQTVTPVLKKLRFPLLTVDGGDAVAVYRAMQESVLRARHGDGPALLWCLMPPTAAHSKHPAGMAPLNRLERYLTARKIALPKKAVTTAKPGTRARPAPRS